MSLHRWLGLAIGLMAIALALSGVVLASAPLIERIASPARYRISGETRLAAPAYVEMAHRRLRPGERIAALAMAQGSSPVVVTLDRAKDGARRLLFLDPPTARILATGWQDGGLIGAARRLHDGRFLAGLGRWLVALGGIGMALASLTGLWAQVARARPRQTNSHARRDARTAAWHRRVGLWSLVPVLAMTATGLPLALSPPPAQEPTAPPIARPALSVDRVVASATGLAHGPLRTIDWPTERSPDWTLRFGDGETIVVKVADDSATAVAAPGRAPPVMLSWVRRLHGGQGWFWGSFAVLAGLAAIGVTATGLIAYAVRPRVRRARR